MSQKLAHAPHSTAMLAAAILAAGTLAGCTSETLFQSNFNTTPIGSPPAATQAIGTASTFGPAGAVVIAGPIGSSTDQWLRVGRADGNAEIAVARELGVGDMSVGKFMKRLGEGLFGRAAAYESLPRSRSRLTSPAARPLKPTCQTD